MPSMSTPSPAGGSPQSPSTTVSAGSGPIVDTGSLPPVPPPPPQPTPPLPPGPAAAAPGVAPAGQAPAYAAPAQGAVSAVPAPIAAASAPPSPGGVPVQPAHDSPTSATPAPLVQTPPVPAPPVPAPPAPVAATAPPLPTTTSTETAQWSRGQQRAVLALSVLAIIFLACASFIVWDKNEIIYSIIRMIYVALVVIGAVQVAVKAIPNALVARGALGSTSLIFTSYLLLTSPESGYTIANVFFLVAEAVLVAAACICLWGHLPRSTSTPRSVVAVSALGVDAALMAVTASLGAWHSNRIGITKTYPGLLIYVNKDETLLNLIIRTASCAAVGTAFVCGIALLIILPLRRSATIARLLSATLGACFLISITPIFVDGSPMTYEILDCLGAIPMLALMAPVFSRSFRQWCDGTWTPPARAAGAVAGRPTILARTFQPVGPDGRPLDHTTVTTLLPTTRLTFWISFFFGLFGLIPMLTANSTAKNLGVVTNAYNHAMIKGLLIGTATWTATTIAFYTLILAALA